MRYNGQPEGVEGEFTLVTCEGAVLSPTNCWEIASRYSSELECPYKCVLNMSGSGAATGSWVGRLPAALGLAQQANSRRCS